MLEALHVLVSTSVSETIRDVAIEWNDIRREAKLSSGRTAGSKLPSDFEPFDAFYGGSEQGARQ